MISPTLRSPAPTEKPQIWSDVKTREFVRNTKVKAFSHGRFYLISRFPDMGRESLKRLRVLDLHTGTCFIPKSQKTVILKIIGNNLLYMHRNLHPNLSLLTINLNQMTDINSFEEVPEWAIHSDKFSLTDGRILQGYWNPQKAELHDGHDVIFKFSKYQATEKMGEMGKFIDEEGLIKDFCIRNDKIHIRTYNKMQEGKRAEKGETFSFDLRGNPILDDISKKCDLFDHTNKTEFNKMMTFGTEVWSSIDDFPDMRLSNEHGVAAFWDDWKLNIASMNQNKILFTLLKNTIPGVNSFENVFFEKDLVIVLMYFKSLKQIETRNQTYFESTCDVVDEEDRDNYHLVYFNLEGSLLKKVKLEDLKEHYDNTWGYSHDYPQIHSANNTTFSKTTTFPKGYLTIHELETKNSIAQYKIAYALAKNDRYIINADYRAINLQTCISTLCFTSSPWNSAKLSGHHLAIVTPEREVVILNLVTNTVVFSELTVYMPRQIVGFSYKDSDEDFIAVQFDHYIKIWYRNSVE